MDEPRRRQLPRKSRSTNCSEATPGWEAMPSAGWLHVQTHRLTPTRVVTTAVRGAHLAGLLRPACCAWKNPLVQPAPGFPANRRGRSRASVRHRRKHRSRPSAKKIAVRKTRDASLDCPKIAFGVLLAGILVENTGYAATASIPSLPRCQPPHNEVPPSITNNMKGRVLSFENLVIFLMKDRVMMTAWAFRRSALSRFAILPPRTSPPNALTNGEARLKSTSSGELNTSQGSY